MHRSARSFLPLTSLLLVPVAAAQSADGSDAGTAQVESRSQAEPASSEAARERKPSASLRLYGSHVFSADLDTAGDFSLTRVGAAASIEIPAGERGSFELSFGARLDSYDFGAGALANGLALPPTAPPDPWGDIRVYEASLGYGAQIDQQWGYNVGASITSSGEGGADFSSTLEYGGFALVTYASSETLVLGLGLSVSSQLEDNTSVFPVPFIRWQIDDKWTLASDRNVGLGGVGLTYQATDSLRFGITVAFDRSNFRLASDARQPDGVGRYTAIPVVATCTWDAHEQLSLTAFAGVNAAQELILDDIDGNRVAKDDASVSPTVGVVGTLRF